MQIEACKSSQPTGINLRRSVSSKFPTLLISAFIVTAILTLPAYTAHAQEIIDGDNESPTERSGMHACPLNSYVVGVHIINNDFLCSKSFGRTGAEVIDGDNEPVTQRNGMHACPSGSAVTGIRVDKNLLLCSRTSSGLIKSEFVDGDNEQPTQRASMHACPIGSVLTGLHVERNLLLCGRTSQSTSQPAPQLVVTENMIERCGSEVAFVPTYDARPNSLGTVLLDRGSRGSTSWSQPFRVQLSQEGRIRWWCHSTTGNIFDPGTWRPEIDTVKTVACVAGGVAVIFGVEAGASGVQQCTGAITKFGTSAWQGWTPERSRCDDRSNYIRARLGADDLIEIQCLR